MNTGQTLLTIAALLLLGTTVLTVNSTTLQHGVVLQQTEIGIYAISLAMGRIEEASGKAFDKFTAPDTSGESDVATSVNQFTLPSALGPEPGEYHPKFDDFDDFHNFYQTVYIPGVDTMKVWSTVSYIDPSDPDRSLSSRTWNKRLDVYVAGSVSRDTVKLSYIFSYWWFR